MGIVTQSDDTNQIHVLETLLRDKDAYNHSLERLLQNYERERVYEDDLFSSTWLTPAHKIVYRAVRRVVRQLRAEDDDTPVIIYMAQLMRMTGLSDDQITRITNELHAWGFIIKDTRKWREGKKWQSEMSFALGELVKIRPASEIVTERKKQGGARVQKCHNCGSENVEPVVYKCLDCGHHGPFDV